MSTTSILRDEVGASATRLGATADEVQEAVTTAEDCTFAAATAGRQHSAAGTAVASGLAQLVHTLFAWHHATEQAQNHVVTAVALYTSTEEANVAAEKGAGS